MSGLIEKKEELKEKLVVEEEKNPFAYHDKWNLWELLKCMVGVVLVPIKFFFAGLSLLGMAFFAKLSTLGMDDKKPMSCARKLLLLPVPWLARLFLFFFGFYWIKVKGKKAKRSEAPVVVIAPHSTFVDTFVVCYAMGLFSGMGKEEASKTPVFGTLFRAGQMIAVKRGSKDARKEALNEFKRRARSDENWNKLVIFPEGTCTNRTALIQFKVGAFVAGVPVQPIILRWPFKNFDPSWTSSSPSRFKLILRLLSQVYNNAEIEFLPVYKPSEEEKADAELYARNVRAVMAEKLGVPTSEHSYASSFLSMAAAKAKCKPDQVVNFEFQKVSDLLGVDLKEAKRLLRRFGANPAVRKTGKMNVEQFARALKVPLTDPVLEMFDLLDTNESGEIDFKAFMIGLTFLSKNTSIQDGIEILYEALDPEGTGKIEFRTLHSTLSKVFRKVDKKMTKSILQSVDKEKTGFVDKEKLKQYIEANPELLVVALSIKDSFSAQGRPLSVFRQKDASSRKKNGNAADQVAVRVAPEEEEQDEIEDEVEDEGEVEGDKLEVVVPVSKD